MNWRAYGLANRLRGDLASLPGAGSITFHAQERWTLFLIMAVSDEAVISLSEDLGLALDIEDLGRLRDESKGSKEEVGWRRIAVGEREGGALRCLVCGPPHRGQPPDIRAERAQRMADAELDRRAAARGWPLVPRRRGRPGR